MWYTLEVKTVRERKDGIKYIIVPKNSVFKKGDYVKITKLEDEDGK